LDGFGDEDDFDTGGHGHMDFDEGFGGGNRRSMPAAGGTGVRRPAANKNSNDDDINAAIQASLNERNS